MATTPLRQEPREFTEFELQAFFGFSREELEADRAASVTSGNASAVAALARFGSAAPGAPVCEAGVQLGKLLRTAFLADYFVKPDFRRELRRVLSRCEAVNAGQKAQGDFIQRTQRTVAALRRCLRVPLRRLLRWSCNLANAFEQQPHAHAG